MLNPSHKEVVIKSKKIQYFNEKEIEEIKTKAELGKIKNKTDFSTIIREYVSEDSTFITLIYNVNEVNIDKIGSKDKLNEVIEAINLKYLEEMRVFSENSELFIWKENNSSFFYRYRIDGNGGDSYDYYEESHILWGTQVKNGNLLSEEARNIQLHLPYTIQDDSRLPLRYKVRNYIKYDKKGFLEFFDARLVKLIDKKGEDIKNE